MNPKTRKVSFHDEKTIVKFNKETPPPTIFKTHKIKINDDEIKPAINTATETEASLNNDATDSLSSRTIEAKFDHLDFNKHLPAIKKYIFNELENDKINVPEIASMIKQSALLMLEKEFFKANIKLSEKLEDFLFYYMSKTEEYNKQKYQLNSYYRSIYDQTVKSFEKNYKIIVKKPTPKNLTVFYKKILKSLIESGLIQNEVEQTLLKYITATIFNDFLTQNNSQYILLNIIAKLMLELDMFYDIEEQISILKPILNDIITFLIDNSMTNSSLDIYQAKEKNKQLLDIVAFLEKNLMGLLTTSAFLSFYTRANKDKIKKLDLSSFIDLNINAVNCQYEKIWGGVSLLARHKTTHKIEFLPADTTLKDIFNHNVNIELKLEDVIIAQTEDYNIQKSEIPESLNNTCCLFKTMFLANNKTYYSGIRFGLTNSVYMNDNIFLANKDYVQITEKLIKASVMAMPTLDIVNAGIDAFNHHIHETPVVYVTSVTITSNQTEAILPLTKYNETLAEFNDKNNSFETALFKLKNKGSNTYTSHKTKLIDDTIFIDLTTKILSFNFIETNDNKEEHLPELAFSNNKLALQNMLGNLTDEDDFTSIKLLENIISGNLNSSQLTNDNSLMANFCKKILTDHVNVTETEDTIIELPDDLKSHLNKLLFLTKNVEAAYKNNSYNTYMFAAHILLISNLIGGAQLFGCENGLTKTSYLDIHIKWLATELFVNNNLSIDINSCATEQDLYKQIEKLYTNKQENMLLF